MGGHEKQCEFSSSRRWLRKAGTTAILYEELSRNGMLASTAATAHTRRRCYDQVELTRRILH
jgi:hypothetical protein